MSDLRESLLSYSSPSSSNHHAVLLPDTQLTPHHLTPPPSRPSLLLSLLTTHRRALILTLSLLSILTLSIAIVLLSSSIPSPTPHPACSSLYHYACADLLSHTTLQPNQSVAGPSNDVSYAIIATLNSILTTPTRGSPLLHTLYSSCMDTARIERLGVQPLTPYLQLLSNSTGWPAFMHALGRMRADFSLSLVLQATLRVNPFDTREGYLQLLPATSPATGLTYSRADYANATLMQLFRAAAESLFLRAGFPSQDSAQRAADAVDGERLLVDLANRTAATTVPWRPTSSINSTFPFDAYMRGAGMPSGVSRFTVPFLAFYDLLASSYPKGPPAQMVAYAQWRLLTVMAPFLSSDVQAAVVAASLTRREVRLSDALPMSVSPFADAPLSQVDTRQDSCRRAVNNAESLGDLLGEQFMLERFNGSARTAVRRMFEHVVEAWHGWVGNLTWLSEQDGLAFLAKVDRMQAFVGGSRRLSAYANLTLDPSAYFDNLRLLRRLHNEYVWTGLVGVYEPERYWQGKPATVVDAAYKYEYNAQYLYAGFFQAAEFWAGEEDDVSAVADVIGHFAYTGDIIGHELGHGSGNAQHPSLAP